MTCLEYLDPFLTLGNTGTNLFGAKPLAFGATGTPSLSLNTGGTGIFNNTLGKPAFGGFGNAPAPAFPGMLGSTPQ